MGDGRRGTCWDRIRPSTGDVSKIICRRRLCRRNWTCSCLNRTHMCRVHSHRSFLPVNKRNSKLGSAECTVRRIFSASAPILILGSLTLALSPVGVQADACTQLAVFHNGRVIANFGRLGEKQRDAKALRRLAYHDKLVLRPGDVIAWRFIDSSYYCFRHIASFVVNGVQLTSSSRGAYILYSRRASPGWYNKNFNLRGRIAADESDPDLTKWLRPRRRMISSGVLIQNGVDYWAPADPSNADTRISNYYWRLQVPKIPPQQD